MPTILNENTESPNLSMMKFYGDRDNVALFVEEVLWVEDYQSITITRPEKYGDCSVLIVIDTSSAGTVRARARDCFLQPMSIFQEITQGG